jgi:phospholipase/carboxylesterase
MSSPLILDPTLEADACIIWLHGLGAFKDDFQPVGLHLQQRFPSLRFVSPQAPTRPVTVNGGMEMPSWYDILAMSPTSRAINEHDIDSAAHSVQALVNEQRQRGLLPSRIFLAGFSQGGAVVLHTAYRILGEPIGGAIALSTYGPTLDRYEAQAHATPTLFIHGTRDNVVTLPFGRMAYDRLSECGVDTAWRQFDMDHEVTISEVDAIGDWLAERLA